MIADADSAPSGGFEAIFAAAAMQSLPDRVPTAELALLAGALLRHPRPPARRVLDRSIKVGRALAAPGADARKLDRRFRDPAWVENPLLRRVALAYLESETAVESILAEAEVDHRIRQRVGLLMENLVAAAAPTNVPLLNPASLREAIGTRGVSLLRGARHLARDVRASPRIPASTERDAFTLGEDLAATPGAVVRRTPLYELIQYAPVTETVDEVPLLVVGSPVNKYYLVDLDPKTSIIGAALARGRQVFVVSWVNPDASHAELGLDAYVADVLDALEVTAEIVCCPRAHVLGLCGGGLLAVAAAGYLAAAGEQDRIATMTVGIGSIDFSAGSAGLALLDRAVADRAIERAERTGYFDWRATATAFAWLRPNDGIWANAVNNYLLGRRPPSNELLFWAADQTNLTAAFGRDLIEIVLDNGFTKPGHVQVAGRPIDLLEVTVDTYILGASTDHVMPWRTCYTTRALLGGKTRFVLARGGHATSLAFGPGTPHASHRLADTDTADTDAWLAASEEHDGTWWEDWERWLVEHEPATRPAPREPGSSAHPPLADAPGKYVRRILR